MLCGAKWDSKRFNFVAYNPLHLSFIYLKLDFMYYVYILKLTNNTYYIGYSSNLKNRLREHENGEVHQTINKTFKPIFYAAFELKLKALQFEKYLKTGSGYAFKNKHLV